MTPKERKAAAAVMASDGPWEMRARFECPSEWALASKEPVWNWLHFEYRVKPKPIVRWVNVYGKAELQLFHESRHEADLRALSHRIACVRIEFTPGQFDE